MKTYDWENTIDPEDKETLWVPQQRDPRQYPLGLYSTMVSALASAGSFLWFESPRELLMWLKLGETKLHDVPHEDLPNIVGPVDNALAHLDNSSQTLSQELLGPIQEGFQGHFDIDWCGNFGELASGETPFALEVRKRFWEHYSDHRLTDLEAQRHVPPDRFDDFVALLSEYGV